mgnify:CR=1 FL=1
MAIFHNENAMQPESAAAAAAYTVDNSCRWNYTDDARLTRTFSSAGNTKLWTWSGWVKRGKIPAIDNYGMGIFGAYLTSVTDMANLTFHTDDTLMFDVDIGGSDYTMWTTAVFRDPAAWYHIVLAYDSAQATDTNRVKIYVNGVQYALQDNSPSRGWIPQDYESPINYTGVHYIGAYNATWTLNFFDGYMADIHFVDGAAKVPGVFAQTDSNGQWVPKEYTGDYGNNGFHIPFTGGHDSELLINSNHREGSTNFEDSSGAGHYAIDDTGDPEHSIRVGNPFTGTDRSIYFDGTGDYLTAPTPSVWEPGTGEFCYELWYRSVSSSGSGDFQYLFMTPMDSGYLSYINFRVLANGTVKSVVGWGSTATPTHNGDQLANVNLHDGLWHHLALSRDNTSDTINLYVDGKNESTFYFSGTPDITSFSATGRGDFTIGASGEFASPTKGYIDDFRVVYGSKVHKAFTDLSDTPHDIAPVGDVAHTTKGPTATSRGSVQFEAAGDYLTIPDHADWNLSGDFTVESWVRLDSVSGYQHIITDSGGTNQFTLAYNGSQKWDTRFGGTTVEFTDSGLLVDTWYHIAAVRSGMSSGNLEFFRDGDSLGTATNTNTSTALDGDIYIARYYGNTTTEDFNGYLDDVRIVKGTAITPPAGGPTTPLETVSGTVFHLQSLGRSFDRPTSKLAVTDDTKLLIQANDSDTDVEDRTETHTITDTGVSLPATASTPYDAAMKRSAIHFDGDGDYLSVPTSSDFGMGTGDFTVEFWVNFSSISTYQWLVAAGDLLTSNEIDIHYTHSSTYLGVYLRAVHYTFSWSPVVDTWYHVAVTRDGTSLKAFIDGSQIGTTGTSSDDVRTTNLVIGQQYEGSYRLNGYLYDICLTKGVAKDPTATGYLTNPFVTTKLTHPGGDDSGNKNHFDVVNLGGHDVVGDSPSAGKNFATFNPLDEWVDAGVFAEGNLSFSTDNALGRGVATIRPSSLKWYGEVYITDYRRFTIGVMNATGANSMQGGATTNSAIIFNTGGTYWNANSTSSYISQLANGNIVSFALDLDNDILWFAVNGTWAQSVSVSAIEAGTTTGSFTAFIGSTVPVAGDHIAMFVESNSSTEDMGCVVNFGQDATFAGNYSSTLVTGGNGEFAYAPPTDFNALCTASLADPGVNNAAADETAFETVLYEGTVLAQPVTTSFQPDLLWLKARTSAYAHGIVDSVRGLGNVLSSNGNWADTAAATEVTATSATSITLGTSDNNYSNVPGEDYVGWLWKGGGGTLFDASGTDTGSRNLAAGFSIVKWTGTDVDGDDMVSDYTTHKQTITHGFTTPPELIIAKSRTNNAEGDGAVSGCSSDWIVYHKDLTDKYFLRLNQSAAELDMGSWSAQPIESITSTTFKVCNAYDMTSLGYFLNYGEDTGSSMMLMYTGDTYIAYCFQSIEGYSKVGSYARAGSATDDRFVHLGFRPQFLLVKQSAAGGWFLVDSARDTYNKTDKWLDAQTSADEDTGYGFDLLSNGFKDKGFFTTQTGTILYYAVAENPFKHANAR